MAVQLMRYVVHMSNTDLAGAVVNVHDLGYSSPALAGTLLEDTNRVLVATVPVNACVSTELLA